MTQWAHQRGRLDIRQRPAKTGGSRWAGRDNMVVGSADRPLRTAAALSESLPEDTARRWRAKAGKAKQLIWCLS